MRIAICHMEMGPGGSEARAMWALQTLVDEHRVDLLTLGDPDIDALNRAHGTHVPSDRVTIRRGPGIPLVPQGPPYYLTALRSARFQRYCQRRAPEYDLMISAYNLCDFGVPGVHFLGDFGWDEQLRGRTPVAHPRFKRWWYRDTPIRRIYLGSARRLRTPSRRDLFAGEDLIVANSRYAAGLMLDRFGWPCEVVYPPVVLEGEDVPWADRARSFVCVGRIAPEKRIEEVIEIVRRLRARGGELRLHLVGEIQSDDYGRRISKIISRERRWIVAHGYLSGREKARVLRRCRYALHACRSEAFGIAVAEQVKAGCIPFVPEGAGPAEIVESERLTFRDVGDAVKKIEAVLDSEQEVERLRAHLTRRASVFSAARFQSRFQEMLERFLRGSMRADALSA